jgi:hypothetical protein
MAHESIQWLASIRGRLGYAWGASLLYVTGGGAWEKVKYQLSPQHRHRHSYPQCVIGSELQQYPVGMGRRRRLRVHDQPELDRARRIPALRLQQRQQRQSDFCRCFGFAAASTCGSNVTRSNDSIDVVRLGLSYKFGGYAAAPVAYK